MTEYADMRLAHALRLLRLASDDVDAAMKRIASATGAERAEALGTMHKAAALLSEFAFEVCDLVRLGAVPIPTEQERPRELTPQQHLALDEQELANVTERMIAEPDEAERKKLRERAMSLRGTIEVLRRAAPVPEQEKAPLPVQEPAPTTEAAA